MKKRIVLPLIATALMSAFSASAVTPVQMKPLDQRIDVSSLKSSVKDDSKMFIISWEEDMRTLLANGSSVSTQSNSIFAKEGLNLNLQLVDSTVQQYKDYISGKTPFFRGTMSQVVMLNELVKDHPELKPTVVTQISWSQGGDAVVFSSNVKDLSDLKGRTIAVMADGPHVFMLVRMLETVNLTPNDVKIVWVKDLVDTDETPMAAFCDSKLGVDAAIMIAPSANQLTSTDFQCKGARIGFSTDEISKVVADVIAVRSDYLSQNEAKIKKFSHAMYLAKEKADELYKNPTSPEYQKWMEVSAKVLLGSADFKEDAIAMFKEDGNHIGFAENVAFFTKPNEGRNFNVLKNEIDSNLKKLGLVKGGVPLAHVDWDWSTLTNGLKQIDQVVIPKFDTAKTQVAIAKMKAAGQLNQESFFNTQLNFAAGSAVFKFDPIIHGAIFDKIIQEAQVYDNTLILVQAHSDPLYYLVNKHKKNATETTLNRIRQKTYNLSVERAKEVREAIIDYAKSKGVELDPTQFEAIGFGIDSPLTGICGAEPCVIQDSSMSAEEKKDAYAKNRRAVIGFTKIKAEEDVSLDDLDF